MKYDLLRSLILIHILCERLTIGQDDDDDDCPIIEDKSNVSSLLAGVVSIYIICLTCAIILLIYLINFYLHRDDPNIEHRHPRLVYATVSIVIFTNIVLFPLGIDYWTLECVTHTRWLRKPGLKMVPMESFLFVTFVVVLIGWLILVVLRVWLLRYDYAASLARKNQIWKKDLGIDGGASTWWINNQQTWGRETHLMKTVAIPYVLAVLLSILLSPIFEVIHHIQGWTAMVSTVGVIAIILCGFIVVNVWKVREIHDNFHIKHEVLLFAKASMIIAIILFVIYLISLFIPSTAISNYIVLIWSILVMFLLTIVSYIQTGWVLYGIRRKNEQSENLVKTINDKWESNITLTTVLKSKEGFEIFMDFLVAEYSTENLLCYVEATQFLRKWKYVLYRMKILIKKSNHNNNNNNDNNRQELVIEATNYVQKQMEKDAESDDEIDNEPWSFHDKESTLIKFKWVKKPPVMKKANITLWDHFKHLRQKYISATSAHQVNIRSALYKHYTQIKPKDCKLAKLDISDVFNDPLYKSNDNIVLQKSQSISNDDLDDEEFEALQPGQAPVHKDNMIEMAPHVRANGSVIQKSQTGQYNRNLRHLYGVVKVLQLIEDTRKELWKNMNDSFVRFRSTENYVNYIKKIYISQNKKPDDQSTDNIYVDIDSD